MRTVKKVQALVFKKRGKETYFLVLHRVLHWKGWELVKETLKKGETPKQAVLRGMKEETGLKKFEIVQRVKRSVQFTAMNQKNIILCIYKVQVKGNEKVRKDQREHDRYKWVKKKDAIRLLTYENVKRVVREEGRNL